VISAVARIIYPVYNSLMQSIQDIFDIWPSVEAMANAINEKPDTVLRWLYRGRIPEDAWPKVIEAASGKRRKVTAQQLLDANAPIKRRGRPPKQVNA
jgi:hypothetical protein